jgi:Ca2+/Na+ antiporter
MLNLIVWLILFIGSYVVIYFAADLFLDNLKDLCAIYKLSPFIIGMLILGIDAEESIASIIAAVNGLPYISFGNVVGNSIIAMTVPISLTVLFYTLKFKAISKFYFGILYITLINLLFSFIISGAAFFSGIFAIGMYIIYALRNLKHSKREKIGEHLESFEGRRNEREKASPRKKIILASLGLVFIFLGGELLILSADHIIDILQIPEVFFGFIIIAFVTNVEELTLILKSVKKKAVGIGFGGMIGKLIWNLTITFGISGIFIKNLPFKFIFLWNWLILLLVILFLHFSSKKEQFTRRDGLILMCFFVVFIAINILFVTF